MTIKGKKVRSKAFEKLYFDNYADLCRRIFRIVRDEDTVKDIVQDVFLNYWQKQSELRITESPEAYLYRSCINRALNYLKENQRRTGREQVYAEKGANRFGHGPEANMIAKETKTGIQNAIDNLSPACKSAFLLSRYEQKSYKEIAELLDISVSTVEKYISKALKTIRENI